MTDTTPALDDELTPEDLATAGDTTDEAPQEQPGEETDGE